MTEQRLTFTKATLNILGFIYAYECMKNRSPNFSAIQRRIEMNLNGKQLARHLRTLTNLRCLEVHIRNRQRIFSTTESAKNLVKSLPEELTYFKKYKAKLSSF